jgi:hypothetical protein
MSPPDHSEMNGSRLVQYAKTASIVVGTAAMRFAIGAIVGFAAARFVPIPIPPNDDEPVRRLMLAVWTALIFALIAVCARRLLQSPLCHAVLVGFYAWRARRSPHG